MVEVPIPYAERVGRSKLSVMRDGLRYLQSIVWTALGYNPVRVLGGIGLVGVLVAAPDRRSVWSTRASQRGRPCSAPWGVAAVFVALVAGVGGVSLFGLGATFNYLLALHAPRADPLRHLRHAAVRAAARTALRLGRAGWRRAGGAALAAASIGLGMSGWPIERLWLYLVGSALLILVGVQLVVSWMLMQTLEERVASEPAMGRRDERDRGTISAPTGSSSCRRRVSPTPMRSCAAPASRAAPNRRSTSCWSIRPRPTAASGFAPSTASAAAAARTWSGRRSAWRRWPRLLVPDYCGGDRRRHRAAHGLAGVRGAAARPPAALLPDPGHGADADQRHVRRLPRAQPRRRDHRLRHARDADGARDAARLSRRSTTCCAASPS